MPAFIGTVNCNNADAYYAQNNNPEENELRVQLETLAAQYKFPFKAATHFESCGPSASVNGLAATGKLPVITFPGGFAPQQESMAMSFFNDPRNFPLFKKVVPDAWFDPLKTPPNRVPALYPTMVKAVFGITCEFRPAKLPWEALCKELLSGHAVQMAFITPGHFFCTTGVSPDGRSVCYNDPWDGREGVAGFQRTMLRAEYETNVKPYAIVYS